ncbi:MAG: nucleotidyltransferase family protein [Thiohalospira sp.]
MIYKPQHIISKFSGELQLLILLSQQNLSNVETEKIETLERLVNWELFFELAQKHRLISHVVKNLRHLSNYTKPEIKKQLKDTQKELSQKALLYSKYLIQINKNLKENNIPHTFFKGPLLSLELYNDIGFRDYRDIDLMVPLSHIENAKNIIQDLGFIMFAPKINLSTRQKKTNYTISHHYHLKIPGSPIDIELHWNLTNPKAYFPLQTEKIITNSVLIEIAQHKIPYISKPDNIAFLAAHGAIHQWYRLFWLKDFSEIIRQSTKHEIQAAWEILKKQKLEKTFTQACLLANLLYQSPVPKWIDIGQINFTGSSIKHCIKSISNKDLRQQGILGKIKFVLYRLKLKPDINYYFSLIFRLRTHYTDWEVMPLPNALFFLYYFLRPFILIYKLLYKK